ncbi:MULTISPECIES: FecR family protein [unclassified Cellulophaga]|uniref:FecR family protein n=1 Tax=unclassified Cellulophaga TaxID=2634405 RepID=UPI0026E455A2|nr:MULTISPECIES: FecR family protein [unclassified Cellulophaga]MDO6492222.1 FecR family protein [Cellulophaga sp. 2_MG-2023]MDO6493172.1 FecR family protein [Cellulophaga sp. 3_MG-2023]
MKKKVSKLDKLIVKYLTRESSKKELDKLEKELNEEVKSKESLKDYIKINVVSDFVLQKFDIEKTRAALLHTIAEDKRKATNAKVIKLVKYAAAAVFAGTLITGVFFKASLFNTITNNTQVVKTEIKGGLSKPTLSLEDGSVVILENGKQVNVGNATTNGKELTYLPGNEQNKEVIYNSLTVPRGGEFALELADGTKVWLNSESKLKYPVHFKKGRTRSVELVYGEAYFDVTSSEDNNGDGFNVITNQQNIAVLGTEFNIKAYKDENFIYSTLVEGHIVLENKSFKADMLPGQQAVIANGISEKVEVYNVNVENEIAWRKGNFNFKNKSLKEIMKVLSRWYDVDFVIENKELENINFKGVLGKNQDIETILQIIKNTSNINAYEIENRIVYIK